MVLVALALPAGCRTTDSLSETVYADPSSRRTLIVVSFGALSSASADDVAELTAHTAAPERWAAMIGHGLRTGSTRPEWLWRARDGDRLVAAVAWWSGEDNRPEMVDLLGGADPAVVAELLSHSRAVVGAATGLCCIQVDADVAALGDAMPVAAEALARSGFVPEVDRVRVEWRPTSPVPAPSGRLTMQSAREIAEPDLLEVFAAVGDGSLDHGMVGERTQHGRTGEAERRMRAARGCAGEPDWFGVGVDSAGALVGYVVPALVDGDRPVIAEIGVAAPHRGHGYGADLLAHGTRVLADAGAPQIRADTDLANVPMRAVFRRAGYVEFARRFDYSWRADSAVGNLTSP